MGLLHDNSLSSKRRFPRRLISSVLVLAFSRFVLSYELCVFRVDHQGGDTPELLVVVVGLHVSNEMAWIPRFLIRLLSLQLEYQLLIVVLTRLGSTHQGNRAPGPCKPFMMVT